ncbi:response regulator transcription factor [Arthrobacter sp. H14]|uniref:response regulator transcription factor n=1 Tax=Arthrobacter sp. H14 TaxID=1312959 RepID=UPI000685B444
MVSTELGEQTLDRTRVAVVIEDDKDIRELIEVVLQQGGFEVFSATNGTAGVEAVKKYAPAIITLDLGLPDIDGYEVARQIRLFSDSYIVMLTARAEELDTLMGLESGADDYLTKPFRPRELRARVAAMMRRPHISTGGVPTVPAPETGQNTLVPAAPGGSSAQAAVSTGMARHNDGGGTGGLQGGRAAGAAVDTECIEHNGLMLAPRTRVARVEDEELELTRTEFDLLHALLESGQTVRTKADLVRWLRADDYDTGSYISDADERAIEVHIGNLRRKLGDNSRSPRWLKTVRGVGYCLAPAAG